MKLIVQVVVGYMYKVMKNGMVFSNYSAEFAAIRHGDYKDFLDRIGKPIDSLVSYSDGIIYTNTNITDNDIDFGALLKAGASLKVFYKKCIKEFGRFEDPDLSNETFEKLCLFELSLRMHRNNKLKKENHRRLELIINDIAILYNLSDGEKSLLHAGRKFLNAVKRPEKLKMSWIEGTEILNKAYALLQHHKLTIT